MPGVDGGESIAEGPAVRAVIFDLDGTLVDSLADIAGSTNAVLEGLWRRPVPTARIRTYVGDGLAELLRRCLDEQSELEAPPMEELLARYRRHHLEHLLDHSRPYPGVQQLLSGLRGRPLAVVTNKAEESARRVLEGLDLARHFVSIAGADTHAEKKPSPLPLRAAMRALGSEPGDTCMVGDGLPDVGAALAAGMPPVAVLWGFTSRSALAAAGARTFARDVAELAQILG